MTIWWISLLFILMKLRSPLVYMLNFLPLKIHSTLHLYLHSFVSVLHQMMKCISLSLGFLKADPWMKYLCIAFVKVLPGENNKGLEEENWKGKETKQRNNVRCTSSSSYQKLSSKGHTWEPLAAKDEGPEGQWEELMLQDLGVAPILLYRPYSSQH